MDRVEVLLATYNSSDYLADMLESLLSQVHDDFHLVVSDDLSGDATLEILQAYAPRFRNPVVISQPETPSGGAMANFTRLLGQSSGDYVFLADHDDIWLPDKIAGALRDLKAAEAKWGVATPIAYHCDLAVIDGAGRPTHPSYWAFKRLDPRVAEDLALSLIQPTMTGCAMAMNAALIKKSRPIPDGALMHDWWLALVAGAFGKVIHDKTPHIQYRIHGKNVSRPKKVGLLSAFRQLNRIGDLRRGLRRRVRQGQAFHARFETSLPPKAAAQVAAFASLPQSLPVLRQIKMIRHGFVGPDMLRNAVQLLLI